MTVPFTLTLVLGVAGLVVPAFDVLRGRGRSPAYVTIAALLVAAAAALQPLVLPRLSLPVVASPLLVEDALGIFFSVAVIVAALLVTVASVDYMREDPNPAMYYSLLLFSVLGMVLLAFAVDLVMIFVAWELMSLPTYVLAGFRKRSPLSNEAAVKYFIIGALSSAILLYAISLTYGLTGTTQLRLVVERLATVGAGLQPLAFLTLALFIAGFGLKLSAVPFHMWIPDAYEGAPTPVSGLLATATKAGGFVAAIRVIPLGFVLFRVDAALAFALLAVLTMTLGNIAALTQKSVTRLLAYSSIAQGGFMLIGLAAAPFSALGLQGVLAHALTNAIMKGTAFVAAAVVGLQTLKYDLDSYRGLGFRMPVAAFSLTVALLALAGVPPLNGFWSKLVLFLAAIDSGANGGPNLTWLAVAGVLNSAFSIGYYGWVIKRMYLDPPAAEGRVEEPAASAAILLVGVALMLLTGIFFGGVLSMAQAAVAGLGLPR